MIIYWSIFDKTIRLNKRAPRRRPGKAGARRKNAF